MILFQYIAIRIRQNASVALASTFAFAAQITRSEHKRAAAQYGNEYNQYNHVVRDALHLLFALLFRIEIIAIPFHGMAANAAQRGPIDAAHLVHVTPQMHLAGIEASVQTLAQLAIELRAEIMIGQRGQPAFGIVTAALMIHGYCAHLTIAKVEAIRLRIAQPIVNERAIGTLALILIQLHGRKVAKMIVLDRN